jgi:hypothetical protein
MKNQNIKSEIGTTPNQMKELLDLTFSLENIQPILDNYPELSGLFSKINLEKLQEELSKAYKYSDVPTFKRIKAKLMGMFEEVTAFQEKNNYKTIAPDKIWQCESYETSTDNERACYLLLYIISYEFERYRMHVCKETNEVLKRVKTILEHKKTA